MGTGRPHFPRADFGTAYRRVGLPTCVAACRRVGLLESVAAACHSGLEHLHQPHFPKALTPKAAQLAGLQEVNLRDAYPVRLHASARHDHWVLRTAHPVSLQQYQNLGDAYLVGHQLHHTAFRQEVLLEALRPDH
jgi:hypothetical protein